MAYRLMMIDDDDGETFLMGKLIKKQAMDLEFEALHHAQEALTVLEERAASTPALLPDLILLDMNMPEMSGLEIRRAMAASPSLKLIPVILMSSSDWSHDINSAYDVGAAAYLVKPAGLEQMRETLQHLHDFWFGVVRLPVHG